jgi:hypothetical protein
VYRPGCAARRPIPARDASAHRGGSFTRGIWRGDRKLDKGDVFRLLESRADETKLLPAMLAKVQSLASEKMQPIVAARSLR